MQSTTVEHVALFFFFLYGTHLEWVLNWEGKNTLKTHKKCTRTDQKRHPECRNCDYELVLIPIYGCFIKHHMTFILILSMDIGGGDSLAEVCLQHSGSLHRNRCRSLGERASLYTCQAVTHFGMAPRCLLFQLNCTSVNTTNRSEPMISVDRRHMEAVAEGRRLAWSQSIPWYFKSKK